MTQIKGEQGQSWWILDWIEQIRDYFSVRHALNLDSNNVKDYQSFEEILNVEANRSWKIRTIRTRNTIIETVPETIGLFTNLLTLDLSHNNIDELPWCIIYLERLTHLDLSDNQLRHLPHTIGYLTTLKVLLVEDNKLRVLPRFLVKLTHLKKLGVVGNPLISPKAEVYNQGIPAIFEALSNNNTRHNLWEKNEKSLGMYGGPETLYELCINCILKSDIHFLRVKSTPPKLKQELLTVRKRQDAEINVMKCSGCHRFFSNKHFFDVHTCEKGKRNTRP